MNTEHGARAEVQGDELFDAAGDLGNWPEVTLNCEHASIGDGLARSGMIRRQIREYFCNAAVEIADDDIFRSPEHVEGAGTWVRSGPALDYHTLEIFRIPSRRIETARVPGVVEASSRKRPEKFCPGVIAIR